MTAGSPLDLAGRHALVAGAASPLSRGIAVALAEAGARVSLVTLADDPGEETSAHSILNECWTLGRDGRVARADLADPEAAAATLEAIEREVGAPVDSLVIAVPQTAALEAVAVIALAAAEHMHGRDRGDIALALALTGETAPAGEAIAGALMRLNGPAEDGSGARVPRFGVLGVRLGGEGGTIASTRGLADGLAAALTAGHLVVLDAEAGAR